MVGGGGRTEDFRYIYQWQKRVIIWKFRVEVCNPRAQKLGKLLSRSFSTVDKKNSFWIPSLVGKAELFGGDCSFSS